MIELLIALALQNPVDTHVPKPGALSSDEVFARRVFLDAIGTLPHPSEVAAFLNDKSADKRAKLVDALLQRPEFADYWSMKWCDILRVKSEFPINLWPNAVQAYHHWIHTALKENRPYDQWAREMLTSSGSNFRVPAVNFYRAVQGRTPADLAAVVALTFMGVRESATLVPFFSRVAYKATSEWKEEIVLVDPAPVEAKKASFPDGTSVTLRPDDDPRKIFAEWLITEKNPWFAKNVVNRIWAWLVGRGIIHEPDDIRPGNPPSNPALLAALERELIRSKWNLQHVYRVILTSKAYQSDGLYVIRRLDAEVLVDALCKITGTHEEYSSPIPEPFTFLPEQHRTILLPDGSITSTFLEMFGRPARDTGYFCERNNESTDAQRLFLLNSSIMQKKIEGSAPIRQLLKDAKNDASAAIRSLYLLILSRLPTKEELQTAIQYAKTKGINSKQAADDLAWALINSKEFLFRH